MENISGEPVVARWAYLSEQSRDKVLGQLGTIIDEIRRIPKPDGRICNADGGSLWDCRLPTSLDRYGPFANTQEFYSFLCNKLEKAPPTHPEVDEMIDLQNRDWGQPVFTYGDLNNLNILVRGDNIVGIVDWETAGWYPPYWEYTTALQVNIMNL
jgi:aminoglycoside phosphotransferase (APT) family kinase protein